MATNASMPKRASTPASKALASASGMRPMLRSNQPVMPHSVLQATITGFRSHSEGSNDPRPMPSPRAHIQELICAGVAPSASAA